MVSNNETDFDEDQYPPAEDRYKQLEDRLNVMEVQKVPGMDFGDLGLSSRVVIPPKFKALAFAKYDGVSCPKPHLRSYVRKIQPYTADKNLCVVPQNLPSHILQSFDKHHLKLLKSTQGLHNQPSS